MPVELIEQVQEMGIYFSEGYGLSESTSLGIANPVLGMKKTGSIGIPFPDNDVRLVDVETGTTDVKPGEPGEIIMKGPLIMKGYWNNPAETAGQLRDGWLYTGDIAQADEDGYLFIVDRKKDMIIAGGFNIYPREIDEVLYQHPKVSEAVCLGIPDEYRGETVKAFVVLKPGETATDKEIIDFCKAKLTRYKVPTVVEFRESLPKSVVGKILRKILRQEEMEKREKTKEGSHDAGMRIHRRGIRLTNGAGPRQDAHSASPREIRVRKGEEVESKPIAAGKSSFDLVDVAKVFAELNLKAGHGLSRRGVRPRCLFAGSFAVCRAGGACVRRGPLGRGDRGPEGGTRRQSDPERLSPCCRREPAYPRRRSEHRHLPPGDGAARSDLHPKGGGDAERDSAGDESGGDARGH